MRSIAALCPAVAFVKRDFHPLVRLLRPELGLLPHTFRRGIVERHVHNESPVRVEYELTTMGRALAPALRELRRWAQHYLD